MLALRQMTKEKMFQIRLESNLFDLASRLAAKRGISLAGLIRMLLLSELEKDKPTS